MEPTSPSVLDAISGWAQGLLAPILATAVSAIYFYFSPNSVSTGRRVLASAHGVSIAVLYLGAMTVFWTSTASSNYQAPFLIALVIPIALIIATFFVYLGPKKLHFLQVLNVLCLLWTFFIGSM